MKLSKECIELIEKEYKDYCKKTGRSGGVLISSSIREITTHLVEFTLSNPTILKAANLYTQEEIDNTINK